MTATLVGNNRATRDAYVPPPTLNENGSPVKWRMFFDGNARIADANDLSDLIEILIEGYGLVGEAHLRKAMRGEYLKRLQSAARANVLASVSSEEWENLTSEERYALSNEEPFGPNFDMGEGEPFLWSRKEPLVLIAEEYAPHTDLTPPLSNEGDSLDVKNIIWLRNESELEFLDTLNHLGVIVFGRPRAVNRTPKDIRNS